MEPWKTIKNTFNHKNHENQPETIKNHENWPKTMKNQPGTMKTNIWSNKRHVTDRGIQKTLRYQQGGPTDHLDV